MIDILARFPEIPRDAVVYSASSTFTVALYKIHNGECDMAYVSNGRVTRATVVALWSKPFLEMGLHTVHGFIQASNSKSVKFARDMGSVRGARPCPPGYVHFAMLRENCKWLPENQT